MAFAARWAFVVAERDDRVVVAAAGGVARDAPEPNAGEEMPIGYLLHHDGTDPAGGGPVLGKRYRISANLRPSE
ncbi:MAG TPA: hypothetical protein VKG24_08385 [Pseudolabrys sp.]|nr:hypothetical protein [Pseudolabrys sp.]